MPPKVKFNLTAQEIEFVGNGGSGMKLLLISVAGHLDKTEKISAILNSLEEDNSTRGPYLRKEVEISFEDWLATININGPRYYKIGCNNPLIDSKLVRS